MIAFKLLGIEVHVLFCTSDEDLIGVEASCLSGNSVPRVLFMLENSPLAYVILYCKRYCEISKCGMNVKDGLIPSNVSIHFQGTDHTEIQTRNGYVCSYWYVYPI